MAANRQIAYDILDAAWVDVMASLGDTVWLNTWRETACYQIFTAARINTVKRILDDLGGLTGAATHVLYLVDRVTPALEEIAADGRIAYVGLRDRVCCVGGALWPPPQVEVTTKHRSLLPLVRHLMVTSTPFRQGDFAAPAPSGDEPPLMGSGVGLGISQSRVSKLLGLLPAGCVKRESAGWVVDDFDDLWDWHLTNYPGPGGMRFSWRSDRTRSTQLRELTKLIGDAAVVHVGDRKAARILRSGHDGIEAPLKDTTPRNRYEEQHRFDIHGPVILYSAFINLRLRSLPYVRCAPADATVQLVQPADPTILTTAAQWDNGHRTDPLITAWELTHGPQQNPAEVESLRKWAKSYWETH
ncbi:hypothetical protein [uncultured Plantibacter sp.]|uniref:hypothetical protein n=1 Tax=uncultured Plantibacter sp. TaxID=293337 RepID=UPI0028D6BB5D|nr:hypothetical protein [uncultured Plantibacter sp.]